VKTPKDLKLPTT